MLEVIEAESRLGNLDELLEVNAKITEWDEHFTREHFEEFLEGKEALIIIGHIGDNAVGFMVGFVEEENFKRWVTGVSPESRGKGVFRSMHEFCEKWSKGRGLQKILSDVALRRRTMIDVNTATGYRVVGFEFGEDLPNSRLFFEKTLQARHNK